MESSRTYVERKISASIIEEWIKEHRNEDSSFLQNESSPYSSEMYRFFYGCHLEGGHNSKPAFRVTIRNGEDAVSAEAEPVSRTDSAWGQIATTLIERGTEALDQCELVDKLDGFLRTLDASGPLSPGREKAEPTDGQNQPDEDPIFEGSLHEVAADRFERSRAARNACIAAHGTTCSICGFDFGTTYGEQAKGMIHVHHITPLHEIGAQHEVDPIEDLIPVCANCHMVLHSKPGGTYTPNEVREMLKRDLSDSLD